ncbi:hypothetical protein B0T10DRAFT_544792 [Thelonectria olida]|uniref:Uncharacterized protein n=1 Tax=Thelonectria olida TaxID=1576542 RepID=A0A9P8WD50_9HYPO|nr:hypothetical protein B0T10DRAFT_544792 [Thelonectria olida]
MMNDDADNRDEGGEGTTPSNGRICMDMDVRVSPSDSTTVIDTLSEAERRRGHVLASPGEASAGSPAVLLREDPRNRDPAASQLLRRYGVVKVVCVSTVGRFASLHVPCAMRLIDLVAHPAWTFPALGRLCLSLHGHSSMPWWLGRAEAVDKLPIFSSNKRAEDEARPPHSLTLNEEIGGWGRVGLPAQLVTPLHRLPRTTQSRTDRDHGRARKAKTEAVIDRVPGCGIPASHALRELARRTEDGRRAPHRAPGFLRPSKRLKPPAPSPVDRPLGGISPQTRPLWVEDSYAPGNVGGTLNRGAATGKGPIVADKKQRLQRKDYPKEAEAEEEEEEEERAHGDGSAHRWYRYLHVQLRGNRTNRHAMSDVRRKKEAKKQKTTRSRT